MIFSRISNHLSAQWNVGRYMIVVPLVLLSLALEGLVGVVAFFPKNAFSILDILFMLGLHIGSSVIAAEALGQGNMAYMKHDKERLFSLWRLGLILALFLPFMGVVIDAVLFFIDPEKAKEGPEHGISPMEIRKQLAKDHSEKHNFGNISDLQTDNLNEMIFEGHRGSREEAIEILRTIRDRQAVSMLKDLSKSEDPNISCRAVEVLTEISNTYAKKIALASTKLDQLPTEDHFRNFGDLLTSYADLEIDPPAIQKGLYQKAMHCYFQALQLKQPIEADQATPTQAENIEDCKRQIAYFRTALLGNFDDIRYWLTVAQNYFYEKNWPKLRETCSHLSKLITDHPEKNSQASAEILSVFALWKA